MTYMKSPCNISIQVELGKMEGFWNTLKLLQQALSIWMLSSKPGFPLFHEHQIQGLFKAPFILYQAPIRFTRQHMESWKTLQYLTFHLHLTFKLNLYVYVYISIYTAYTHIWYNLWLDYIYIICVYVLRWNEVIFRNQWNRSWNRKWSKRKRKTK